MGIKNDKLSAEQPAVEVFASIGGHEVLTVAFFQSETGIWDVLVGIEDADLQGSLANALKLAGKALEEATFHRVDTDDGIRGLRNDIKDALSH